jgi:isoaspartyl peptidase/L-asparaginase-like protein (Ntn-hydrolase superfamily)
VQIAAIVSAGGSSFPLDAAGRDTGPPADGTRVYQLGAVSATATTDTMIEETLENPFDARIPYNADIQLRFAPVIGGCEGDSLTIPYRTGPRPTL